MKIECMTCSRLKPGTGIKQTRCYNANCPAYKAQQVLKQMAAGRMHHAQS